MVIAIIILTILLVSAVTYIIIIKNNIKNNELLLSNAKEKADKIVEDAQKEANDYRRDAEITAKEMELKLKDEIDTEIKERRAELSKQENRLFQKEEQLGKKEERIEKDLKHLDNYSKELEKRELQVQEIEEEKRKILEQTANLSEEEAKKEIINILDKELVEDKAKIIKKYEEEINENAKMMAKNVITTAIQKCAADHTSETTLTVISIPSEEMKGRIIGKDGRNIRSLEMLTGVQIIIDDTPEAITLSAFDPVRTAVAKLAIEKLLDDGRIHPGKIEEIVEKATLEIADVVRAEGKRAMEESGVSDLNSEEIMLLGKLKYRTSYGQNVLTHSIEVSNLAGIMADLVGANKEVAKRAALLHDIGKALDHDPDIEGTHVELGVEVLNRAKESKEVIHAVEAHHNDVEPETVEAILVQAADTISASRPGARRDTFEAYIKRIQKLEEIATEFEGVNKSYAIQAGREIRLIVDPEKISDSEMTVLAHDISKKIEDELPFPGKIKVTVLRETRKIDYAKQSKVNRK